jgi:putative ABC transport system permease protein
MRMFQQDIRQAIRTVLNKRLFSLAVALTLGVGIGANTAIFTVANALLNHPIDFPQEERLVSILERKPQGTGTWSTTSAANYVDWRQRSRSFAHMAAYAWWDANLTGVGEPMPIKGFSVSPAFFEVLGMGALRGRVFTAADVEAGHKRLVVLSYGLSQRLFQNAPKALGATVRLNGAAYKVIGVMPESFQFPAGGTELWIPLLLNAKEQADRKSRYLSVVGKLKPGVSCAAARAELSTIAASLAQQYPETNRGWGVQVDALTEFVVGEIRPFVLLLTGIVAIVLLIACVNVSILQFARSSSRELELATRVSLGAPRLRIFQQLLAESVAVSLLGGLVAFLVGFAGVFLIRVNMPAELAKFLPGWSGMRMDGTVFAFTLAVAVLCGVLCGLAPALQLSRTDLNVSLKGAGRAASGGKKNRRWREALVAAEVVLAVALLVGAMAIVDAFQALVDANQPFAPERVLALNLVLPVNRYPDSRKMYDFYSRLVTRLRSLPGVESAAAVSYMPFADLNATTFYTVEGEGRTAAGERRSANYRSITPGFFATLRIPLRRGRSFNDLDRQESPPVAIVSRKLAAQSWPGQDPIGKRLRMTNAASAGALATVVGVVADVRQSWLDKEIRPTLYVPMSQAPQLRMDVLVRAQGGLAALMPSVRKIVSELDREQPIRTLRTMERAIHDVMLGLRFVMVLMIVASGVALLLAIVGIYSVVAYLARERLKEMGIRAALGATPGQLLSLVLHQGLRLTAVGIAAGLLAGFGLTRLLASVVAGVRVLDPGALFAVLVLAILCSLLASYLPARSAAGSDPMTALRNE